MGKKRLISVVKQEPIPACDTKTDDKSEVRTTAWQANKSEKGLPRQVRIIALIAIGPILNAI